MIYESLNQDAVEDIQNTVETDFETLNDIINEIIRPYCESLDRYVEFIRECLKDGEQPPTNSELEDWCLNLSTYIYFAGGMTEQLGIKDDISKAIYKEVYNNYRQSDTNKGTIADKNSLAELASQQEYLTSVCYARSYRIMKSKVENAQELLQSVKKTLSHRMQEMELTKLQ